MNEKEAIERLNRFKTIKVLYGNTFSMHLEQLEQLQNDIETLLNLLEKKDRTIQQLKDENKTLNRQAQQYFETTIIQSQQYDKETTKKDKIINEMAMSLYDYANLEVVINCPAEYDENYDLSKCRMNLADRNCINCIKQYYERKVENGN